MTHKSFINQFKNLLFNNKPKFIWRQSYPDRLERMDDWCVSIEDGWGAQVCVDREKFRAELHSSDGCFVARVRGIETLKEAIDWVERNYYRLKQASEL